MGNGMGGRRVGKKYNHNGKNYEESSNYYPFYEDARLHEWQALIESYNKHNRFIKHQKRKWLPPREKK